MNRTSPQRSRALDGHATASRDRLRLRLQPRAVGSRRLARGCRPHAARPASASSPSTSSAGPISRPRTGAFDFTRLDEIIGLLHEAGIRVNLGTGTSSPPPWLTTRHPEILPVVEDGTTRYPGGRQAWCPSSPVFRAYALALVDAVAERYGDHPAVALWHVSNELGCHNAHCYCDVSADCVPQLAARRATDRSTRSIARGARASGASATPTGTRSARRDSPSRPATPVSCSTSPASAPTSSSATTAPRRRRSARHSEVPDHHELHGHRAHPRTSTTGHGRREMDVIANDHYLDHRLADPAAELAFAADLTRGLAGGAPWMLMEHSTGAVNWQPHNLAEGAGPDDAQLAAARRPRRRRVCFFQWRASLQGSEKFHSALLPHAGTDSRALARGPRARRAPRPHGRGRRNPRRRRRGTALQLGGLVGRRRREPPERVRSPTSTRCGRCHRALRELGCHGGRRRARAPT